MVKSLGSCPGKGGQEGFKMVAAFCFYYKKAIQSLTGTYCSEKP